MMTDPIEIDNLDDPRLAPYRSLKDRELAREGGRFIAEGRHVVERLLASRYACESVLTSRRALDKVNQQARTHGRTMPIYVAPDPILNDVVGFRFHSGSLAVGVRGALPGMDQLPVRQDRCVILACEGISNGANLGGLIRTAAGFGVDGVLLGPHCIDPFWRLAVRVSMGTVFSLNLAWSNDLPRDLFRLRDEARFQTIATVCEGGEPIHEIPKTPRSVIVMGSEAQGLDDAIVRACSVRATIPMKLGTDSLNVMIAAAVFLYETQRPRSV
jgi:tRNA G18 (ribose-2'-O)-methylase SpoU